MAIDLTAYKNTLKARAEAVKATFGALPANDPKKAARIAELNAKWQGLKDQEAEIGKKLAEDTTFKPDDALLTEIDALKTAVSNELVALGQAKPT